MITNLNNFVNESLGSSFDITRARVGGASVIPLLSSLLFFVPPSVRRKVLGAKPKQAGKKEGGWGEGIFARLLPFPFRLSKGKAEGGFGGNSAFPLRNQIEASPATCLNTWKAEHRRKILFSLEEEKIGRAQNEKSKEYFSVVWRACRAVAGLASLLGVLLKKSSNINQKTPPVGENFLREDDFSPSLKLIQNLYKKRDFLLKNDRRHKNIKTVLLILGGGMRGISGGGSFGEKNIDAFRSAG